MDGLANAGLLPLRTRRIAVQSALGGVLVSLAAMAAAAVGLLPPAAGALLQEGVDVAVVLNTLHADRAARPSLTPDAESLIHRFTTEHEAAGHPRLRTGHRRPPLPHHGSGGAGGSGRRRSDC
ncbi:hypothetical protein [Streptomyces sp. CC77]|uniref:hypothetical protein n=1 Tax=Streptomyces sp. CC77 TaxID=1906739 RepID=UPI0008DDA023|nr:hypothetical protein BJP39_01105 [Streptomyces sp. CC77]